MKKLYPLIFLITATILMPFGIVSLPKDTDLSTIIMYLSAVSGYIGIILLLWIYILGTRTTSRFLNNDSSSIIKIHNFLGKYGVLIIFLHPILLTIRYSESWLYSFIPDISSEYAKHVFLGQIAFYVLIIVWVTSALLRARVKYRPWKYIHYLAYIALPFSLLHIPEIGSQYDSNIVTKIYFLFIVVGFVVFGLIRLRSFLDLDKFKYQITNHIKISDRIFLIRLKPIQKNNINIKNGQYVYIKDGLFSEDHPFSVLDFNKQSGVITIAYKVYGYFTEKLSKNIVGKELLISGSFGDFTSNIDDNNLKPVIYIAAGIGITPFYNRLINENDQREQWLFYLNTNPESAILKDPIEKSIGKKLVNIYSSVNGVSIDRNMRGQLFMDNLKSNVVNLNDYDYYMCGPDPLMKSISDELVKNGVSKTSIFRESFNL